MLIEAHAIKAKLVGKLHLIEGGRVPVKECR
jgi:hypothetical protein